MKRSIFLSLALLFGSAAWAQQPDRHGEVTLKTPSYHGTTANAPIPPKYHVQNEGGSDGAGLCVIASVLCNGRYQQIPGLERGKESELWKVAKSRKGGYYDEKLKKLVKQVLPNEKWVSIEGSTKDCVDILKRYSAAGYPIAATMSTGAQYGYMPIHHMISLVHLDANWACVVDNNDAGKYHWMPAKEFLRRFQDGASGWLFVWLRSPGRKATTAALLPCILFLASGLMLIARKRPAAEVEFA
jgi:hypothetical protein